MKNSIKLILVQIVICTFIQSVCVAQEFPIAIGPDTCFSGGGAFDGNNYVIAITGDATDKNSITFQFFDRNGNLVGNRIGIGKKGGGPQIAFDGKNYLLTWNTYNWNPFINQPYDTCSIFGQFFTPAGSLTGGSFKIASGVNYKLNGVLAFNDTSYMLTYLKGGKHIDYIYAQLISRSGALINSPVKVSANYSRECAMDFDGSNYLIIWVEGLGYPNDRMVYGQFLSKSATLVGSNFVIDAGYPMSDNPISVVYDGSRYMVAFHEQAVDTNHRWNLYSRFVSTSGIVSSNKITICDSTKYPFLPMIAFDGSMYLSTWIEMNPAKLKETKMMGRFLNSNGLPVDTPFTLFKTTAGKFPVGGVVGFVNNAFIIGATRLDTAFTNGDVYAWFLDPYTNRINTSVMNNDLSVFPNPAADRIKIHYTCKPDENYTLNIYDMKGIKVKSVQAFAGSEINPDGLQNGVYLMELVSNKNTLKQKIIIHR